MVVSGAPLESHWTEERSAANHSSSATIRSNFGGHRRMRASKASARRAWLRHVRNPSTRSSYIHLRYLTGDARQVLPATARKRVRIQPLVWFIRPRCASCLVVKTAADQ
jgi:hypothetical protein